MDWRSRRWVATSTMDDCTRRSIHCSSSWCGGARCWPLWRWQSGSDRDWRCSAVLADEGEQLSAAGLVGVDHGDTRRLDVAVARRGPLAQQFGVDFVDQGERE